MFDLSLRWKEDDAGSGYATPVEGGEFYINGHGFKVMAVRVDEDYDPDEGGMFYSGPVEYNIFNTLWKMTTGLDYDLAPKALPGLDGVWTVIVCPDGE